MATERKIGTVSDGLLVLSQVQSPTYSYLPIEPSMHRLKRKVTRAKILGPLPP